MKLFFWLALLLFAYAPQAFSLYRIDTGAYINDKARYLIDEQASLSPEQAFKDRELLFPVKAGTPHFLPVTQKPVWILLELDAKDSRSSVVLSFSVATMDSIESYQFSADGRVLSQGLAGDEQPFEARSLQFRLPAFKFKLEPGRNYLIFKLRASGPMYTEARIWPEQEFRRYMVLDYILVSACFGAIFVICLYNLILYSSIRDPIFLFYSLYLFFLFITLANLQGMIVYFENLADGASLIQTQGLYLGINSCTFFALVFVRRFLNVDLYMPRARIFFDLFIIGTILASLLILLDKPLASKLCTMMAGGSSVLGLVLGLRASWRRYKPAYVFVCAWSHFLISTFSFALTNLGILEFRWYYPAHQLPTAVIEGVVLSFALGYRLRLSQEKQAEERKKKDHYFSQLEKVFYSHQLAMMQEGRALEETMPTGRGQATIIAFDIANSSAIGHARHHDFFEAVMKKCQIAMSQDYDPGHLTASAFRIKEMGDGFLCSVGFPFKVPGSESHDSAALRLAMAFVDIFKGEVEARFGHRNFYCGVGIAKGEVNGYFPSSGTKEYDLFGQGIIHATRYESMRKVIMKGLPNADILILQESVHAHLHEGTKGEFAVFDLASAGITVRDDHTASKLYFKLLNPAVATLKKA
jgi:class 3 adenylate cyclase